MMKISNVKFIDSLNYFPMALSKLPKAFDLPEIFKKGYFPHFFNTVANENYVGDMPDPEFYGCDSMSEGDRKAFLSWYEVNKNKQFNLNEEIESYCISDVQVLTEACLKFRTMFLNECKVEPFLEAITIASACNLCFRRIFLKPETIGLIPKNGYRLSDKHSKSALQWLIWQEDKLNVSIQHAGKGKEVTLHGKKVDGYADGTDQIFEFYGCYYHGCEICFQAQRDEPFHNDKWTH